MDYRRSDGTGNGGDRVGQWVVRLKMAGLIPITQIINIRLQIRMRGIIKTLWMHAIKNTIIVMRDAEAVHSAQMNIQPVLVNVIMHRLLAN